MTALFIILAAIAILIVGYITYGSWLAKQWGIDPSRKTPAIEKEDGVDYVAAPPAVLMGHHFSSIAGAGPINGPIQASVFGWLPVFLWCVIGGIFFGGLQDFGSLFASIRHDGKSLGEIIHDTMGKRAKRLFLVFALLVLILVIASFVNVVAGTFFTEEGGFGFTGSPTNNQTTAMISLLFIVLAIAYGYVTNKMISRYNPMTIVTYQFSFGALLFLPFFLIFGLKGLTPEFFSMPVQSKIMALAVLCSCVCFGLWAFCTGKLGVTRVNIFSALIPLVSATASYFLYPGQETFTLLKIAGIVLTIMGVIIVQIVKDKQIQS
jgi:carbon starvation protein CstA